MDAIDDASTALRYDFGTSRHQKILRLYDATLAYVNYTSRFGVPTNE